MSSPAPAAIHMYDSAAHFSQGLKAEMHAALDEVIEAGYFHGGPLLREFESSFAKYCGTPYAVGVCSGTVALYLALKACGVGPGDEVITAPNSDIATASAIHFTGAKAVWVDIDERTYNLDPDQIGPKITARTRAILPVHLYGLPADLNRVIDLSLEHDLVVIEDAALALGATYKGRHVGSFGKAGCFSFSETKTLGALGTGGMVTAGDPEMADAVARLRSYGEPPGYGGPASGRTMVPEREGLNATLGALQARFLQKKMSRLEGWLERRRQIADMYREALAGAAVILPHVPAGYGHAYRTFVIRLKNRNAVRQQMRQAGVITALQYTPPLHLQEVYDHLGYGPGSFPATEKVAEELLCLPIYPEMSDEQVVRVAEALRTAVERMA